MEVRVGLVSALVACADRGISVTAFDALSEILT